MKRLICVVAVLLFLLGGCTESNQTAIESFSYEADCDYYKDDDLGVKRTDFINTEKSEVTSAEQAVVLAKNECTVEHDTISVAFDADTDIYRVSFSKKDWLGGNQDVYINKDGITQLIVYGE